jgi:hypothetical protein
MRVLVLGLACIETTSVECEFATCPAATVCDELHDRCVAPDQLITCGAAADGSGTPEVRGLDTYFDTLFYVEGPHSIRRLLRTHDW